MKASDVILNEGGFKDFISGALKGAGFKDASATLDKGTPQTAPAAEPADTEAGPSAPSSPKLSPAQQRRANKANPGSAPAASAPSAAPAPTAVDKNAASGNILSNPAELTSQWEQYKQSTPIDSTSLAIRKLIKSALMRAGSTTVNSNTVESKKFLKMHSGRTITNESFNRFPTKRKKMYEGMDAKTIRVMMNAERLGHMLAESKLSAEQISQIFTQSEEGMTKGGAGIGSNRTMIGKGKDMYDAVQKVISDIGAAMQQTAPVKFVDRGFDAIMGTVTDKDGQRVLKPWVQKYRQFAQEHPAIQNVCYTLVVVAAGLCTAGYGASAAAGLLKAVDKVMQGEKFSTAIANGLTTGAKSALIHGVKDWASSVGNGSGAAAVADTQGDAPVTDAGTPETPDDMSDVEADAGTPVDASQTTQQMTATTSNTVDQMAQAAPTSPPPFQFNQEQTKWLGNADPHDPNIVSRMPDKLGPKPPYEFFDPKDMNKGFEKEFPKGGTPGNGQSIKDAFGAKFAERGYQPDGNGGWNAPSSPQTPPPGFNGVPPDYQGPRGMPQTPPPGFNGVPPDYQGPSGRSPMYDPRYDSMPQRGYPQSYGGQQGGYAPQARGVSLTPNGYAMANGGINDPHSPYYDGSQSSRGVMGMPNTDRYGNPVGGPRYNGTGAYGDNNYNRGGYGGYPQQQMPWGQNSNTPLGQAAGKLRNAGAALSHGAAAYDHARRVFQDKWSDGYQIGGTQLTEAQVAAIFYRVELRGRAKSLVNEGPVWDAVKKGAKGVADSSQKWLAQKGKNITTIVTADKLQKAWDKASQPTDSDELIEFLVKNGVNRALAEKIVGQVAGAAPAAGTAPANVFTNPQEFEKALQDQNVTYTPALKQALKSIWFDKFWLNVSGATADNTNNVNTDQKTLDKQQANQAPAPTPTPAPATSATPPAPTAPAANTPPPASTPPTGGTPPAAPTAPAPRRLSKKVPAPTGKPKSESIESMLFGDSPLNEDDLFATILMQNKVAMLESKLVTQQMAVNKAKRDTKK